MAYEDDEWSRASLPLEPAPAAAPPSSLIANSGENPAGLYSRMPKRSKKMSCDGCRTTKRQCDLGLPCNSCLVRNAPCTYAHVDPVVRQERLDAIEAQNRRRTDSLRYLQGESSDLLAKVDELKHRLGLSDEELGELYAEANELALRERNDYDRLRLSQHPPPALPVGRSAPAVHGAQPAPAAHPHAPTPPLGSSAAPRPTPSTSLPSVLAPFITAPPQSERSEELKRDLRRSTRSSAAAAQDRQRMPPPAVPPSAYTRISPQGAHGARDETGAARAMGLDAWRTSVYEEWEDDRGSESSGASANQRFRPEGPPPLPPSDLAGRIYPAAPYHFPHTYPPPALPPIVDPPRWRLPLLPPEACAPVPPHFVRAAASEGGGWWNAPPPLW